MTYKVLVKFKDKKTKKVYEIGDKYPANFAKARLEELLSTNNNLKQPVIEKAEK